jgi:hypothetical protein
LAKDLGYLNETDFLSLDEKAKSNGSLVERVD